MILVSMCLTGCSVEHMAYLEKTRYEENTQDLAKDLAATAKEVSKDTVLANIANGQSTHFKFQNKVYREKQKKVKAITYKDLVNRDDLWCIRPEVYKGLGKNERMQFLRDVMLIINDSTNDVQQVYSYCNKITKKFGYTKTDIIVNTNLLYEQLKDNGYKESKISVEKGTKAVITKDFKSKKKYKNMIKQIRSGKIGETKYSDSTYTYLYKGSLYTTGYKYALNEKDTRLINGDLFGAMTKESQENFLTDICVLVNRQSNLKYYGKKKQSDLEKEYKDYVLNIIKADTGVDASQIMKNTWNGDTRKKAVLDDE